MQKTIGSAIQVGVSWFQSQLIAIASTPGHLSLAGPAPSQDHKRGSELAPPD